jgi:uncharacterized protein (TIGR02145 family)
MKTIKIVQTILLILIITSCGTSNTSEKRLSKNEQIELLNREIISLQRQMIKEGSAAKSHMSDLEKKLTHYNAKRDSLYQNPIIIKLIAENRVLERSDAAQIIIPKFSYETDMVIIKSIKFAEKIGSNDELSKKEKIEYLKNLKTQLMESILEDREKTRTAVQALEKEIGIIETVEKELAKEEKIIAEKKAQEKKAEQEKLRVERERRLAEQNKRINQNITRDDKQKSGTVQYGEMIDKRDRKVYKTIKIGSKVWMAENLAVDYRDMHEFSYNDPSDIANYGHLYPWRAACQVSPNGWRLPSYNEWQELINYLGGEELAAIKMKSISGWRENDGTNESGFSALPGGYRDSFRGNIYAVGWDAGWWTSSQPNIQGAGGGDALSIYLKKNGKISTGMDFRRTALSVRCIKN